jgi:uncharacterized protein
VVIDDTAVTPTYVVGLPPNRELAIIWAIAKQSLINKLCILTPIALFLGYIAPWSLQPILMIGGAYLCTEGIEKIHAAFHPKAEKADDIVIEANILEKKRINSAVRTDMILSAEIIAITYAQLQTLPLLSQAIIMCSVSTLVTIGVYGCVAIIVKADDVGLYLVTHSKQLFLQKIGRWLLHIIPPFLKWLSVIGTIAMLWVGGEIIIHGIAPLHHALETLQHHMAQPFLAWCATVLGMIVGSCVSTLMHYMKKLRHGN